MTHLVDWPADFTAPDDVGWLLALHAELEAQAAEATTEAQRWRDRRRKIGLELTVVRRKIAGLVAGEA